MASLRQQRTYDHRLRDLIRDTGDTTIATRLGVPRSTAAGWLRRPKRPVISSLPVAGREAELRVEVLRLRRRVVRLAAILRIVFALLNGCGIRIDNDRVPIEAKRRFLSAVERARGVVHIRKLLRVIGLSASRYLSWKRAGRSCELEGEPACPKVTPHRLTPDEVRDIHEMVTSPDYRHVPTGTLAVLAQRLGRVFASGSTWYRLIRERGWRRPRLRIHPQRPTVGIRARKRDQIWHIDTTIIKLLDGTRCYLHAVIDNFSRRILSWKLAERFDPASTVAVLLDAGQGRELRSGPPMVLADSGVENRNQQVDELVRSGLLRRVLAMTELRFSNSMIEAWWRSLKNQWLYLHSLDGVAKVRHLIEFYVSEHNSKLPHSAFRGQTPDVMYFGTGGDVPDQLEVALGKARLARLASNRFRPCPACDGPDDSAAA